MSESSPHQTTEVVTIDTGTDELLCRIVDRVAVVTLNRPAARNALSDQLTPALRRMVREQGEDPAVGCLLITGAGTAFCAGGDVKGMGAASTKMAMTQDEAVTDLKQRQRLLTGAIVAVRKPTIAALPGAAAGAGLAIALACDIRIAAASAFAATGYARIGLSGDYGIAWLLTRAVGNARARELMFAGDRIDAQAGLALGLFNHVVPDGALEGEALALARKLARGPAEAFAAMKDNLDAVPTQSFAQALDGEAERLIPLTRGADHHEAVRAFVEKRAPVFRGGGAA